LQPYKISTNITDYTVGSSKIGVEMVYSTWLGPRRARH